MPCMAAMQKKSKKAQVSNLKLQVKKSRMGTTKSTPRFLQKLFELVNEHKMTTIKPHSSHIFEMATLKKELMKTFPISNYTSKHFCVKVLIGLSLHLGRFWIFTFF